MIEHTPIEEIETVEGVERELRMVGLQQRTIEHKMRVIDAFGTTFRNYFDKLEELRDWRWELEKKRTQLVKGKIISEGK